ncbi:kynurenine 3-monooxygenase cn [Brevipalpus obovatus]|uniref:kynurenine 3-monooxygenase cn n=1 Tax=Brevipalpus obovatus TaxID=246614 RepID=UPI003D9F515A
MMSNSLVTEGTVAVVGGGLVGSLVACVLAKRGYRVELFEMRGDIRQMEFVQGKSINLALSERGRSALRLLDLEKNLIEKFAIPMRARLIHDLDGRRRAIPYGREGQFINSISRRHLNEILLTAAEEYKDKLVIRFDHKLLSCKLDKGEMQFLDSQSGRKVSKQASVIIGSDGAHSRIRDEMMRRERFKYSQEYIDHGYLELCIPPDENGRHRMELNYLHIWPRGSFMMIALPNLDGSYTVTLFMPFSQFEAIKSEKELIKFFGEYFPDSIELIGRKNLVNTFFQVGPSSLISLKCDPYNYKNKALLIGDAAHAMVPFYGQGMNCGLEDVTILDQLLENFELSNALEKFSEIRVKDGHAICELALYNYIEMRDLVNSRSFILRKYFDNFMNRLLPNYWIPLYTMVTFSRIPYSECIRKRKQQDNLLGYGVTFLKLISLIFVIKFAVQKESSIILEEIYHWVHDSMIFISPKSRI